MPLKIWLPTPLLTLSGYCCSPSHQHFKFISRTHHTHAIKIFKHSVCHCGTSEWESVSALMQCNPLMQLIEYIWYGACNRLSISLFRYIFTWKSLPLTRRNWFCDSVSFGHHCLIIICLSHQNSTEYELDFWSRIKFHHLFNLFNWTLFTLLFHFSFVYDSYWDLFDMCIESLALSPPLSPMNKLLCSDFDMNFQWIQIKSFSTVSTAHKARQLHLVYARLWQTEKSA